MGKYVWSCSLCLHEIKRKSNAIRHIRLVHGIDPCIFENNETMDEMNKVTEASREHVKFYCNGCSYNKVKKYNLMRHWKSVHSLNERRLQEEERHYNMKEFEEIMNRLKATAQLSPEHNSKLVKAMPMGSEKTYAKIREGYLKAMEILTR